MRRPPKQTTEIDGRIAERMKFLRVSKNMSQTDIAKPMGITFQQYQKYEKSINRISAARLITFLEIVNVDMNDFLRDIVDVEDREHAVFSSLSDIEIKILREFSELPEIAKKEALNVIRSFKKIFEAGEGRS